MEKYKLLLDKAGKRDYPLGSLLVAGLAVLDLLGYRFNTPYDRKILAIMTQIYGCKDAGTHLRLFWAARTVYLLLSLAFTGVLALVSGPDMGLAVFGLLLVTCVIYFTDRDIKERLEKRKRLIRMEFPDFVNRLALLINAGMTVERAWSRTAEDSRGKDNPLYDEVRRVSRDMRTGKSELQAYEDFAKRCRVPEVTRFVSVLIQNLRKGGSHLVSVLRISASECWQERKNAARKMGEEASTKMILPLMLVFFAILLIAATPAILALKSI